MAEDIKNIVHDDLIKLLEQHDKRHPHDYIPTEVNTQELELKIFVDIDNPTKKAVLGIDIYRYSKYKALQQTLMPMLFKILYNQTVTDSHWNTYIFQKYQPIQTIEDDFISTGDGGFQIFDTPLHCLVFALQFALNVRKYNSYHYFPKLREIIGEINLRYAITYDDLYGYDDNFYGTAIINNARILAKDPLNRCLIDEGTNEWFMRNIGGIEDIRFTNLRELKKLQDFSGYDDRYLKGNNLLIPESETANPVILAADILKIGEIKAKGDKMSIYNIHLQAQMRIIKLGEKTIKMRFTVTLGNLNTADIETQK